MNSENSLIMYVYRMMLTEIFNEIYSYNTKLPSLEELCTLYNAGRNTIRSALLLLESNGYISLQRGSRAKVIFHHDDEKLHDQYKQALLDMKSVSHDVFETMGIILPTIGVECFKQATPQQIDDLIRCIDDYDVDSVRNEKQIIIQLFNIYKQGFAMLNNPVLDDLIDILLYSMYYPHYTKEKDNEVQRSTNRIHTVLKMIVKTNQKGNYFIIKNMIAGLCLSYGKTLDRYIDKECQGMTIKNKQKFMWSFYQEEDYLYMQVVFYLVNDINNHVYNKGDLLPSIAQISEKYNVSDRTSRRALKALKDYKMIKVINGVGSKVIVGKMTDHKRILKQPEIKANVEKYVQASELMILMNEATIRYVLKKQTQQESKELSQYLKNLDYFSLTEFLDYIYKQTNECLYTIYKELQKAKIWGVFANMFTYDSFSDVAEIKNALIKAVEEKDIDLINKINREIISISTRNIDIGSL